MKRIEIEEVGLDDDAERRAALSKTLSAQSEAKKNIVERDTADFERFTVNSPADIPVLAANQSSENDNKDSDLVNSESKLNTPNGRIELVDASSGESSVCDKKTKTKKTTEVSKEVNGALKGNTSPRRVNLAPKLEFSVPATSVQFQADYRQLKADVEAFYQYFKVIYCT